MIRRTSDRADGQRSEAFYSTCGGYRYGLRRVWREGADEVLFVMLNPSTADETRNDPTIERCQRRAEAMGFGGLRIANLFAYRATHPRDLKAAPAPVGPGNDALLRDWARGAALTVAGWGVHGGLLNRGPEVAGWLGPASHLGLTRDGHPRHPLYVAYATAPMPWPEARRYVRPA